MRSLLDNLRVPASLRVFSLSSGQISSYESIVRGTKAVPAAIETALGGDAWWEALKTLRQEDERRTREASAKKNRAQPVPSSSAARKQSKKEQKQMGVTLPKEHLEYFKRNMRIGLAHPRSSKHRADHEVGVESESEYEESDSESDLSDELARLDLDDLDWMSTSSPSSGLKRAQTYSMGGARFANGHDASSTKDLTRRATGAGPSARARGNRKRTSGVQHTGGSSKSSWSSLPDEPSSQALLSRRRSEGTAEMSSSYGSLSTTPRPGMLFSSEHPSTISEAVESDQDGTLKASDRAKAQQHLRQQERRSETRSRRTSTSSAASTMSQPDTAIESSAEESDQRNDKEGSTLRRRPARTELPFVSFNSLPNKAQYLILK